MTTTMLSEQEIEDKIYPIINTEDISKLIEKTHYKYKDAKWINQWLVKKIAELKGIKINDSYSDDKRTEHYNYNAINRYVYNVLSTINHYDKQRNMGF